MRGAGPRLRAGAARRGPSRARAAPARRGPTPSRRREPAGPRAKYRRRETPVRSGAEVAEPLLDPRGRVVPGPLRGGLLGGGGALRARLLAVREHVAQLRDEVVGVRIGPAEALVVRALRVRGHEAPDGERVA